VGITSSSLSAYENQLLLDSIDDDFDWDKLLWSNDRCEVISVSLDLLRDSRLS